MHKLTFTNPSPVKTSTPDIATLPPDAHFKVGAAGTDFAAPHGTPITGGGATASAVDAPGCVALD